MTNVKTSEKNEIVGEEPGFLVERAEKPPQDPKICALALKISGQVVNRLTQQSDVINLTDPRGDVEYVKVFRHHGSINVSVGGLPPLKVNEGPKAKDTRHALAKKLRQKPQHVEVLARALWVS